MDETKSNADYHNGRSTHRATQTKMWLVRITVGALAITSIFLLPFVAEIRPTTSIFLLDMFIVLATGLITGGGFVAVTYMFFTHPIAEKIASKPKYIPLLLVGYLLVVLGVDNSNFADRADTLRSLWPF